MSNPEQEFFRGEQALAKFLLAVQRSRYCVFRFYGRVELHEIRMTLNVGKELAALERMSVGELRRRYAELSNETTAARSRKWLIERIISSK